MQGVPRFVGLPLPSQGVPCPERLEGMPTPWPTPGIRTMPRIGLRSRVKPVNPCQILCSAGVERLEQRSLFSAYVFHDALSGLGVPSVIAENGPPLPPQGVEYERYGHGAIALGDLNLDGFGDYAVSA